MIRSSCLRNTSFASLRPGELIRHDFGMGPSFLLFLSPDQERFGKFGVLKSPSFETTMKTHNLLLEGDCLSYGTDWFLEEIHDEETKLIRTRTSGEYSLLLGEAGLYFRFLESDGGYGNIPLVFNLSLSQIEHDIPRPHAPINQWRLWATQEDFNRGTTSLVEMSTSDNK